MTTLGRTATLLIGGAFCGSIAPSVCLAQVQLPAVNLGFTNFEDGLAAPGWIVQEFPVFYDANEQKDAHGKTLPGTNHLTSNSTTTHLAVVSGAQFLGGWLSFEALEPLVDLHVRLASGGVSKASGFGDPTFAAGVQWPTMEIGTGTFTHRLMFAIGVPIGEYSDKQPVNIGNHFVVLDPYYAFTYEWRQLEVSGRLHYLWNSVNSDPSVELGATSIQAGQAFHMNFSASYELSKNVRIGFNGYWLQQLADNKINRADVTESLERTLGLGGGIQIFLGQDTWFHLNGYSETYVRNRAQGYSVIVRLTKIFPGE